MRFEQHAIKVLEIAHDKSAEKAKLLLVSTVDGYGALTLLDLAMNGQSRAFIGNVSKIENIIKCTIKCYNLHDTLLCRNLGMVVAQKNSEFLIFWTSLVIEN